MTEEKIKQMQTALLMSNAVLREILNDPSQVSLTTVRQCLERGQDALKVEVLGRS